MTPESIREKIYAGLIGKAVGVRLGAPVEPTVWDAALIGEIYGEIDDYVRDYENFAADDDTNGPLVFIRALADEGPDLTPEAAGRCWLDYIADGHGMLWWGGFGVSTEETAYTHLKNGVSPPASGSIERNGLISAEQIGGQIFSDCWGWVCPGEPAEAARLACIMASVSHDGEALNGAAYVAGATAAAFVADDIAAAHRAARALIADDSHYARVLDAVSAFYAENPGDWRACFAMLEADFGYDKWTGVCHVIPNAGVVALALLYGGGDMPKTAAIATMCGWDTDCNAGNAANIAGVLQGVRPHWAKWRRPINDTLTLSAVTGALNIVDMPSMARDLASLSHTRKGTSAPAAWTDQARMRGIAFDFALAGATHGFRAEGSNRLRLLPGFRDDALAVQIDRWAPGEGGRLFWKPFYRRDDFDDNRYRPMLSPVVASGQTVTLRLAGSQALEGPRAVFCAPYVRLASSGRVIECGDWALLPTDPCDIVFAIPETDEAVDEIGVRLEHRGNARVLLHAFVHAFSVTGPGHTVIVPARERQEWGAVSRFSFNRGAWTLEDGHIVGRATRDGDLWTGHSFAADQRVTAHVRRLAGESHLVSLRVAGARRFYAAGIENGRAVILAEDFGRTVLAEAALGADSLAASGADDVLQFEARGETLTLSVNGRDILQARDDRHRQGMAGLRLAGPGEIVCSRFEIEEFQHG